jgi:hypothetical protein
VSKSVSELANNGTLQPVNGLTITITGKDCCVSAYKCFYNYKSIGTGVTDGRLHIDNISHKQWSS